MQPLLVAPCLGWSAYSLAVCCLLVVAAAELLGAAAGVAALQERIEGWR